MGKGEVMEITDFKQNFIMWLVWMSLWILCCEVPGVLRGVLRIH